MIIKLSLIIFLLFITGAYASEIVLKSGEKVEGKIVEQTDKYVKFDEGVGVMMTYFDDEIDTIDGKNVNLNQNPSGASGETVNKESSSINYVVSDEEKSEFTDSFTALLSSFKKGDYTSISNAWTGINDFRAKHVGSPLSRDAEYVLVLIQFKGAVTKNDKSIVDKYLDSMRQIVQVNRAAVTTELTRKIWADTLGEQSACLLYIPYYLIIDYMQGLKAFFFKDDSACVKSFTKLKDQLNFELAPSKQTNDALIGEIYTPLAVSYIRLNQKDNLNELIQEVSTRLPDKAEGFKQMIQTVESRAPLNQ